MLTKEELKRYSRHTILPEIGIGGQDKLKNASVLMVGAGGLGCPVLQYLVAIGVGKIGIVDDDRISISNLHRQILYSANDIGRLKSLVAKEKLEVLNPYAVITAYPERLTSDNAAHICSSYDLLIDGSDNFNTRYLLNDTSTLLGKPLVFGSIFKFEGHVAVFNYQNGPNYRDVFPEPPAADEVPNCDEIGVLGILPGIIGTYMANEAFKVICEIGETLSGKLLTIDSLTNNTTIFSVTKRNNKLDEKVITIKTDETRKEITYADLKEMLAVYPNQILLVDVRENYEFEESNIGGVNIPLYELSQRINELPRQKTIVLYCQTGSRSRIAMNLVKAIHDADVYSLKT